MNIAIEFDMAWNETQPKKLGMEWYGMAVVKNDCPIKTVKNHTSDNLLLSGKLSGNCLLTNITRDMKGPAK